MQPSNKQHIHNVYSDLGGVRIPLELSYYLGFLGQRDEVRVRIQELSTACKNEVGGTKIIQAGCENYHFIILCQQARDISGTTRLFDFCLLINQLLPKCILLNLGQTIHEPSVREIFIDRSCLILIPFTLDEKKNGFDAISVFVSLVFIKIALKLKLPRVTERTLNIFRRKF